MSNITPLKGKIAVITGGSRGIGAAVAEKLASMGADIAVIYAGNAEAAEQTCIKAEAAYAANCTEDVETENCIDGTSGIHARSYKCDVSDFEQVKQTVARIKKDMGNIHILINNAGITRDGIVTMMKEENFDAVLDTNLKGAFNMIRHCGGQFLRNKEGCIINISSVSGLMGNAGQSNYAASKAGLIGLTKSVAKELASRGIRCNAIAPGFISTDMTENQGDNPLVAQIPLGRLGLPEEIADAVAFLVTADYITGEVLRVDGGIAM